MTHLSTHLYKFVDLKARADEAVEDNGCIYEQLCGRLTKAMDWNNSKTEACYQQHGALQNVVKEVDKLRVKTEGDKKAT